FNNLVAFNDINGEGYNFISDIILQIDQHNSQIAARLLSAFSDWKKYNSQRQSNAKLALEKIAGQENISNDIADLVTRILK
ncbi:aminopeptidase N C-terminal domain-containing protein, partial [Escherichia coli]|uniref:aminopeptidase N C-terminal domain-containing protein n=1 Tax=Escherichia coli TaxID=562 RepID=UPI001F2881C7